MRAIMERDKSAFIGGRNMHPNFWLIMVCAVVAIGTGVIASKKKKKK
jgi:hypothetical protein